MGGSQRRVAGGFLISRRVFQPAPNRINEPSDLVRRFSHGQRTRHAGFEALHRNVLCTLKNGRGPAAVGQEMQTFVRLGAKSHGTTGPDLMITCVPRKSAEEAAAGGNLYLVSGRPNLDTPTFLYASPRMQQSYGPHFVVGKTYMGDMKIDAPPGKGGPGTFDLRKGPITVSMGLGPPPPERQGA